MKVSMIILLLVFSIFSLFPDAAFNIILLETMPVKAVLEHSQWFLKGIEEINRNEQVDIRVQVININGDKEHGVILLKKALKAGPVDLVITNATLATQVAYQELKDTGIPQAFFTVSDPVGAGIIKEVGQPTGEKVTGLVFTLSRETKLNILYRMLDAGKKKNNLKIGFIHSSYPSSVGDFRELNKIAQRDKRVQLIPWEIEYRKVPEGTQEMINDCKKAIKKLEKKVDYWFEPSGPLGELSIYTETLLNHSKNPICFGNRWESSQAGALFFITPDRERYGKDMARLAYMILQGEDPGKIPPIPPDYFKFGINISTALKLNIVIPQDLLELAGDNVYQ